MTEDTTREACDRISDFMIMKTNQTYLESILLAEVSVQELLHGFHLCPCLQAPLIMFELFNEYVIDYILELFDAHDFRGFLPAIRRCNYLWINSGCPLAGLHATPTTRSVLQIRGRGRRA